MYSQNMQEGAIVAREASSAVIELKVLVDRTAEKVRAAERHAIGMAIGQREGDDALTMFRIAAEDLHSADFETALAQARTKTQAALARLSTGRWQ
jgi:myo-inositol catabolism protein IolC